MYFSFQLLFNSDWFYFIFSFCCCSEFIYSSKFWGHPYQCLMSLSSRLLFPVFLGSYLDLLFKTYFLVSFWFFLGVCFYELGKTATSPSVAGVALCRSFPFVNCMVGVFGGAAGVGACVCCRETQGQSAPGLSWPTGWSWSGYSLQGVPGASYLGLP